MSSTYIYERWNSQRRTQRYPSITSDHNETLRATWRSLCHVTNPRQDFDTNAEGSPHVSRRRTGQMQTCAREDRRCDARKLLGDSIDVAEDIGGEDPQTICSSARNIQTTQITLLRIPGPVLGEKGLKNSQPCVGPGWVDGVNDACSGSFPLPSQSDLANWFNERLRISYDYHDTDTYMIPFDDSEQLVFVLGSLSMDNIIIDDEGCLWLTDFSRAGVYPPWFEYCGMRGDQHKRMPQSWQWLRRFVCGSYSDQERFLRQVNRIPVKPRKYTKTRLISRSSRRLSRRPSIQTVPERHIEESFVQV